MHEFLLDYEGFVYNLDELFKDYENQGWDPDDYLIELEWRNLKEVE